MPVFYFGTDDDSRNLNRYRMSIRNELNSMEILLALNTELHFPH